MKAGQADALTQALFDFDGKSTAPLERFAAAYSADADLIAALCDFAGGDDGNLQAAATWLLKRFGVTGAQLSPSQSETLLGLLMRETGWLARLHVLQMMDSLTVPSALAAPLMGALTDTGGRRQRFHPRLERSWRCRAWPISILLTATTSWTCWPLPSKIRRLRCARVSAGHGRHLTGSKGEIDENRETFLVEKNAPALPQSPHK